MNLTAYIKFEDFDLTVRGYHIPGERDTNTAEQFEVHEVFVGEHPDDIADLLGEARCNEIAAAVLARGSL